MKPKPKKKKVVVKKKATTKKTKMATPKRRKKKSPPASFKPDRIGFFLTVPVGMTWKKLTTEGSFSGDFQGACKLAQKMVEDAFAAMNPNGTGVVGQTMVSMDDDIIFKRPDSSQLKAKIEACTSLQELETYKLALPSDLMPVYMKKMKQL